MSDPTDHPELWMGIQMDATESLDALLKTSSLDNWDKFNAPIDEEFIKKILALYKCGAI
jgi:hypothetical protein